MFEQAASNLYFTALFTDRMKRNSFFVIFLLLLAGVSGYVLSKASFVGRMGITLFYRQYRFLKVWWQAGLLVFTIWMILFFLQGMAQRRWSSLAKWLHYAAIAVAVAGLYFTYQDFRNTTSHRWLGERFHLGGYLFWIGWIIISVFYLTGPRDGRRSFGDVTRRETLPANEGNRV
jgi:hypothetical protein